MGRRSKSRQLDVWMNGELVGHWRHGPAGEHQFDYSPAWLETPTVRPISLSMPLRPSGAPYHGTVVEAYFDNLLPDSLDIRRRIQARFGAASSRPSDLLNEIGRDCVGAVQLLPPGDVPRGLNRIRGEPLSDAQVAAVLRRQVTAPLPGQREENEFRISIAGAQEKTALLWHAGRWHRAKGTTPTTHIFKLPLGRVGNMQADLSTSVENEWLCSRIIRAFGLPIAHCEMARFEDLKVLIVERFDRKLARTGKYWLRLPVEDMCQATGTLPADKYEADGGPGNADILSILLGSREASADRTAFFKAQLLFWMLAAADGHAKNFSVFLEPGGRYSLTPLYDVISAYPVMGVGANQIAAQRLRMAMAVSGKNRHYQWDRIRSPHWITTARRDGLGAVVERLIDDLTGQATAVVADVSRQLPKGFPASVADPVLSGVEKAARRLSG